MVSPSVLWPIDCPIHLRDDQRRLIVLALAHLAADKVDLTYRCKEIADQLNEQQQFTRLMNVNHLVGHEHVLSELQRAIQRLPSDTTPLCEDAVNGI